MKIQNQTARLQLQLCLLDILFFQAAVFCAASLRMTVPFGTGGALSVEKVSLPPWLHLMTTTLFLGALLINHAYNPRRILRWFHEIWIVAQSNVLASFVFGSFLYLTYRDFSRLQFIYLAVLSTLFILSGRLMLRTWFRLFGHSRPGGGARILVLGAGSLGRRIQQMVEDRRRWGYSLIGYLDDDPVKLGTSVDGAPILGEIDQVEFVVESHHVNEVWVALPPQAYERMQQVITRLEALPVRIYVVPNYFSLALVQARSEVVGGIPVIGLREPVIQGTDRVVKRIFDVVVSGFALVFLSPLFLLAAAAVKLNSRGPVFFRQQRAGENGALFGMLKFRTMVEHAESLQVSRNRKTGEGELVHKHRDDPRVTRVGRFLRRYSLDELPQLINVLRGEMSLVGPRPEMPWLVDRYDSWQRKRFAVPQGITGWWQINGRSDRPMHLNTEDDLYYVYNYSFWLDLRILIRTPLAVLQGRGAF